VIEAPSFNSTLPRMAFGVRVAVGVGPLLVGDGATVGGRGSSVTAAACIASGRKIRSSGSWAGRAPPVAIEVSASTDAIAARVASPALGRPPGLREFIVAPPLSSATAHDDAADSTVTTACGPDDLPATSPS
jgi:hypothetical protein